MRESVQKKVIWTDVIPKSDVVSWIESFTCYAASYTCSVSIRKKLFLLQLVQACDLDGLLELV